MSYTFAQETAEVRQALSRYTFTFEKVTGIGHESGVTRRDPSDVIISNGKYHVYYTKVFGRAAGYWGTIWHAYSTDSGFNWTETGEVLGTGDAGTFDAHATFTPNILKSGDTYYLFYTGVRATPGRSDGVFENNDSTDITAIGVAVSDSPSGPFKRLQPNAVLEASRNPDHFDSYRVDDAALLYRDQRYWLYYKGRSRIHGHQGPHKTRMGVAFADHPAGPYTKHGPPLLAGSHEVLIWPFNDGVAALASLSKTIEFAPDGLDFLSQRLSVPVKTLPLAAGAFRPELTQAVDNADGLSWGISMVHNGNESYLVRWQIP